MADKFTYLGSAPDESGIPWDRYLVPREFVQFLAEENMFTKSSEVNQRIMPDGHPEGAFRREVRDVLNLDIFTRDEEIYEELRRLKALDTPGENR